MFAKHVKLFRKRGPIIVRVCVRPSGGGGGHTGIRRHNNAYVDALNQAMPSEPTAEGTLVMAGSRHDVEVRIRGGGSRGVLEFRVDDGEWDAVCDDYFDSNNNQADAVCKTLGYEAAPTTQPTATARLPSTTCALLGLRASRNVSRPWLRTHTTAVMVRR